MSSYSFLKPYWNEPSEAANEIAKRILNKTHFQDVTEIAVLLDEVFSECVATDGYDCDCSVICEGCNIAEENTLLREQLEEINGKWIRFILLPR
jgi:hypothetical protein